MCGEGGMPIAEWCSISDLKMVSLWMEGYNRRHRAIYDVGKVVARSAVAPHLKHIPEGYPYTMPWEVDKEDATKNMSEEQKDEELKRLIAEFTNRKQTENECKE